MKHIPLTVLSLLLVSAPVAAADLGPSGPYIERPPVVERERIIERRYVPVPVYRERRVYVEPPFVEPIYVAPRVYRRYGYPYGYGRGYPYGYGRGWHPGRFHGGGWGHGHRRW